MNKDNNRPAKPGNADDADFKRESLGIFYVILSAVLFGTMPLLARIAYAHGSNPFTVAFGRFLFGSIGLGLLTALLPGQSPKLSRELFLAVLKLSVPYALVPILLYASYTTIDSGMATALHFTYPIAVMLIMAVFRKARLEPVQIVCTALCVGGIALFNVSDGPVSAQGILMAVGSGIFYAVYIVLLGKSTAKALPPLVLSFWVSLLSAVEIGLISFCTGNLTFELEPAGWAAEIVLALFATVLGLVLFQQGVLHCREVKASLFSTFEPLTGIVIGAAVFHEALTPQILLGMAGILAAAVLLVLSSLLQARRQA